MSGRWRRLPQAGVWSWPGGSDPALPGAGWRAPAKPAAVQPACRLCDGRMEGGWQVEKTTKSGDTVEYKAIKGTAAVEIEISSAGAGASITVKVI